MPADTVKHTPLSCCPFCGGKAEDGYYEAFSTDSSFDYIGCDGCGVMIPYNRYHDGSRETSIAAWNSRFSDPVREKLVEQIDRLSAYFRDEAPGDGFEGDVEGWSPVETAIAVMRRKRCQTAASIKRGDLVSVIARWSDDEGLDLSFGQGDDLAGRLSALLAKGEKA